MAPPRAGGPRRSQHVNEHIYTLGERGRKTGVTLRDTGERDEHGMEPLDNVFSSPAKSRDSDAPDEDEEEEEEEEEEQVSDEDDEDDDNGEADMDLTTASGPDPAALLNGQSNAARLAALRLARSPAKTLFGSPAVRGAPGSSGTKANGGGPAKRVGGIGGGGGSFALRQNHQLKPPGSPDAGVSASPTKPVKRKLDFGKAASSKTSSLAPPTKLFPGRDDGDDEDEEEEDEESILHGHSNGGDDSMQMVDASNTFDDPVEDDANEEEEEEEEPVAKPAKRRGRPSKDKGKGKEAVSAPAAAAASLSKTAGPGRRRRPGRPSGGHEEQANGEEDDEADAQPPKRQRIEPPAAARGRPRKNATPAMEPPKAVRPVEEEEEQEEEREEEEQDEEEEKEERQEPEAGPSSRPQKGAKGRRKRKSSGVGAAAKAVAAVPRGPPLPKSRGLVIRRRGQGGDEGDDGVTMRTRSGRTSFRPLAFWRNEHVEFDPSEVQADTQGRHFLLPAVKEIHHVEDEVLQPFGASGHRGRGGGGGEGSRRKRGGRKRRRGDEDIYDDDDDNDDNDGLPGRDTWEHESGTIGGMTAPWDPAYELNPPAPGETTGEEAWTEIATAASAIAMRDVRDGSFRFGKTLSLPFFGTGVVDLPPGAEKRSKNARKMYMAFFVHYGQVVVTVHETVFRIAKGGTWSVPRGNTYSILNDTDRPARIFFAQGCETLRVIGADGEE